MNFYITVFYFHFQGINLMREIEPKLTQELNRHRKGKNIGEVDPYLINSYRELVKLVAKLAYKNKDYLLFFRGQPKDFKNKAGSSTFYPSIYRSDYLSSNEIGLRFKILENASSQLKTEFKIKSLDGYDELKNKKYIQYSILQHYEVCRTPLLDFTHSLRVACSFAQLQTNEDYACVFVFGLPYITHRITYNSEHDLVNVRLLSICPPDALRPYFQDGYLAGTMDITADYFPDKTILDFNKRLIAKFKIPTHDKFWGNGFSRIPEDVLYPEKDKVKTLCDSLSDKIIVEESPEALGKFIDEWKKLEHDLQRYAREYSDNVRTVISASAIINQKHKLSTEMIDNIDQLRRYRNEILHGSQRINYSELANRTINVITVRNQLNNQIGNQRH